MPASPLPFAHTGIAILGSIVFVAAFAGLMTWIVAAILLARYRARIARLMAAGADGPAAAARACQAGSHAARYEPPENRWPSSTCGMAAEHRSFGAVAAEALYRETWEGPRRLGRRYAAAGSAYVLVVATCAYFAFSQLQVNALRAASHPLQFALLAGIVAWPIVLTLNVVDPARRARRWARVLGYFAALTAIGIVLSLLVTEAPMRVGNATLPGWSGESPARVAAKWCAFNAAPCALIVVFRALRVRAIAPLVAAFMAMLGAGLLAFVAAALTEPKLHVGASVALAELFGLDAAAALAAYVAVLALAACLAFAFPGWLLLAAIRRAHARKGASDQSIEIGAQWLLFAAFHAAILAYAGAAWALAPALGVAAFVLAYRMLPQRAAPCLGPSLLVLRVFSLGRQSERLFESVAARWRHAGSVILIAGTDLAASTVAPRQFLAFVSGRLHRLFVRTRQDIDAAVANLDRARDADGRFRVNDFFCGADSWQDTLARLVGHSEVVLMDLRRFGTVNAGCMFEIEALLRAIPAHRLVFVVDRTTDAMAFETFAHQRLAALPAGSPNAGLSVQALQRFPLERVRHDEVQALLLALCHAATAQGGQARRETRAA